MATTELADEQIRSRGLKILYRELRPAGLIHLLKQFESGTEDYSVERHEWLQGSRWSTSWAIETQARFRQLILPGKAQPHPTAPGHRAVVPAALPFDNPMELTYSLFDRQMESP